jgi:undecaprenyl-phosphate 4-deoxy-4-formamido-L-arabinose transferase
MAEAAQGKGCEVSVVVPVYNEHENIPLLWERLIKALRALGEPCELIFVDDGSKDNSLELLKALHDDAVRTRVVELARNAGQHPAILAGFEVSEGEIIVTLDADLQNPPEEIPNLVAKVREGYDVVAGWRKNRQDSILRKLPSLIVNRIVAKATGVQLHDYGCMLRAYRKHVVKAMVDCQEHHTFIPALANALAKKVTEIEVGHSERATGDSKYPLKKLLRLNFDLMTGFTQIPLRMVSAAGLVIALLGILFGVFLFVRRLIVGAEAEGVFTLFAILFIFIGVQVMSIGVIGEYLARIYDEVRARPRYMVRKVWDGGKG